MKHNDEMREKQFVTILQFSSQGSGSGGSGGGGGGFLLKIFKSLTQHAREAINFRARDAERGGGGKVRLWVPRVRRAKAFKLNSTDSFRLSGRDDARA